MITAENVVVVGLGLTGLSVVNFLQARYPQTVVRVIDTRQNPSNADKLPKNVELHCGGWQQEWLSQAQLVVLSPGVSLHSAPLAALAENGVEIIGDIELFARHVQAPVVAITGSNGKSTVTTLLGEMAKAAGIDVAVGGNIGVPALDLLDRNYQLYVLELSSFQLETTKSLTLAAATFLNLSEDHMDRYSSLREYQQAKLAIFARAQLAIVNGDDPQTWPHFHPNLKAFSLTEPSRLQQMKLRCEYNLQCAQELLFLNVRGHNVLPSSEVGLIGQHNLANCLAAMALADGVGIGREFQLQAIREFAGLAHRCQKVIEHQGVVWVNDSKATNPASTLAALSGLTLAGKLHLLLGGDGKGADFAPLQPVLARLNIALYCFGKDGQQLAALHENSRCFASMEQAMAQAAAHAVAGDMVLLSPACASLDQFTSFVQRGEQFADFAKKLAMEVCYEN
ncbi:MAG: UDP-N-acetylmuramoyl-L-alanine--D-glutamate ligase [Enterovibrio sp.]